MRLAVCQMEAVLSKSFTVNDMARGCSQWVNYGHILTFAQESGWIERWYQMTSGHALNNYCQVRRVIPAARPRTIGASLKPFCGSCVPAVRGEIFRRNWAIGTGHLCDSRAGVRRVSGNAWRRHCKAMPTWSICSSTRPSCVPTRIPSASKKSRATGNRSFAGRTDDQAACRGGCLGQSAADHPLGRADRRHRAGHGVDSGSASPVHCGRQGIRLGCLCGSHYRAGLPGSHPATFQPAQPAYVRPAHLQEPKSDRAFLRTHQAIQTHRHPLRQTRPILPVVRSSGLRYRLVGLIENTP
jgi:hypothetical protein